MVGDLVLNIQQHLDRMVEIVKFLEVVLFYVTQVVESGKIVIDVMLEML